MADVVNIAAADGLPDILLPALPVPPAVAMVADALGALSALGSAPWGIYQGGAPVVVADTVLDLSYNKAYAISDYPIEGGGFASYNKVETPYEGRVRFASGGSPDVRAALIASVEGVVGDLNLYDVVTPDQVYVNANVVREEYRRTSTEGGASLLTMDVSVQEVRILSGAATGQSTADPASEDQQNGGTVQPAGTVGLPYEVTAGIDPAASSAATGVADVPLPPERPASLQPSYSQGSLGPGGQLGHA